MDRQQIAFQTLSVLRQCLSIPLPIIHCRCLRDILRHTLRISAQLQFIDLRSCAVKSLFNLIVFNNLSIPISVICIRNILDTFDPEVIFSIIPVQLILIIPFSVIFSVVKIIVITILCFQLKIIIILPVLFFRRVFPFCIYDDILRLVYSIVMDLRLIIPLFFLFLFFLFLFFLFLLFLLYLLTQLFQLLIQFLIRIRILLCLPSQELQCFIPQLRNNRLLLIQFLFKLFNIDRFVVSLPFFQFPAKLLIFLLLPVFLKIEERLHFLLAHLFIDIHRFFMDDIIIRNRKLLFFLRCCNSLRIFLTFFPCVFLRLRLGLFHPFLIFRIVLIPADLVACFQILFFRETECARLGDLYDTVIIRR